MYHNSEKIAYKVGSRIRAFRIERRMSQETLAFNSDMHPAYLGKIERGEKCPTVETLCKISSGLKIPVAELLKFDADTSDISEEAYYRIMKALSGIDDRTALKIAEIVEKAAEIYTDRYSRSVHM